MEMQSSFGPGKGISIAKVENRHWPMEVVEGTLPFKILREI
jgi:hypothetical protein